MASRDEIDSAIEAVIRAQLQSALILSVLVEHDVEIDGSTYLQVRVIVRPKKKGWLDPGEMVGMIPLVREHLFELGVETFPLIDYIDEMEAGDLAAA